MQTPAPEVFELFPTPLMRVPALVDAADIAALRAGLVPDAGLANHRSDALQHTRLLTPDDKPLLGELVARIEPHLVALGGLLFGERLQWSIKEMWVNVMRQGGSQAVHNHANCFISGVLYLSDCDAAANTVFVRSLGGRDYVFGNTHSQATVGPFNADKWKGPPPAAGDLLLFPSYLLHEVPVHHGAPRLTLAFNAIPHRLDAWGYALSFSA